MKITVNGKTFEVPDYELYSKKCGTTNYFYRLRQKRSLYPAFLSADCEARLTSHKAKQALKAYALMPVTLAGMLTELRPKQTLKASGVKNI